MKSTKRHFKLEIGEYLFDGDMCCYQNITIFRNKKDITNLVVGVILVDEKVI